MKDSAAFDSHGANAPSPPVSPAATEAGSASGARRRWASLAATVLATIATVVLGDLALQRVQPLFPPVRHVHDGIADLEAADPTVIVLGSSHARSFDAVKALVEAETRGRQRLVTVPVEMGGFSSYRWVLEHRIAPLLGAERPSARHLLLVTTFYDACSPSVTRGDLNIPARAWTLLHYVRDVRRNGLTDFNRNYVRERWKQIFPSSVLVQDRGAANIAGALKRLVRPEPPGEVVEWARGNLEAQAEWCRDEGELAALASIADFAAARGLTLTVVLFPLVPDIVTEKARRTTLAQYADRVRNMAEEKAFRVADLTLSSPLVLADFAGDLDHVTRDGNRKFAEWALANDLRWLWAP